MEQKFLKKLEDNLKKMKGFFKIKEKTKEEIKKKIEEETKKE